MMEIHHGGRSGTQRAGNCMALTPGECIRFHNPGASPARYLLALPQVGFKFGRWLDLAFYQRLLDTLLAPVDG